MDTKLMSGILNSWLFAKKFGFVAVYSNGITQKYFLHSSKIQSGAPAVGSVVYFNISPVREGLLPSAIDAVIVPQSSGLAIDGGAL
jgi:hypothetical protein